MKYEEDFLNLYCFLDVVCRVRILNCFEFTISGVQQILSRIGLHCEIYHE